MNERPVAKNQKGMRCNSRVGFEMSGAVLKPLGIL